MKFPLIKRTHHDTKVAQLRERLTEAKRKTERTKTLVQKHKSTLKRVRSEYGAQIRELERICEIRRQELENLNKSLTAQLSLIESQDQPPSVLDAPIGLVAGDIVNNCNLRCPFCIVDYANVKGLKLMSHETFQRAIELLPMTQPGSFWLSCLHEPTLHPQFIDFIESVPDACRDRISFTTNLSKNLPDDWMERLANSGIHSIRVSFDSRQPEVFAALRKNAKYETFEKNLLQLSKALQASPRRPLLHFITMAFKDNYRDIPNLVRYCRELGGDQHDIRYIYYTPHVAHWGKEHVLNTTEWAELERSLTPLASPTLIIEGPAQGIQEQFDEEQGLSEYVARENAFGGSENSKVMPVPDATLIAARLPDAALQLRLRWDGVIISEQLPEELFRVNINQLNSPPEYFSSLRPSAM